MRTSFKPSSSPLWSGCGHQVHGDRTSLGAVDLGQLGIDRGDDVVEPLGLALPAALVGFVELVDQSLAGSFEAGPGGEVWAGQTAFFARGFIHAACAASAQSGADW